MMKTFFALLLFITTVSVSYGFMFEPRELTTKNLDASGFAFTVRSEPIRDQLEITVRFTKATSRIQAHPLGGLEIINDQGKTIVSCQLESIEDLLKTNLMQFPTRSPTPPTPVFSLTCSFSISKQWINNVHFWIRENGIGNSAEAYWFLLSNFVKVEPSAAANP